jgi:hypothetical protein
MDQKFTMTIDELNHVMIGMIDYSCGRSTYITIVASDLIRNHSDAIMPGTAEVIAGMIEDRVENRHAGMKMDVEDVWKPLLSHIKRSAYENHNHNDEVLIEDNDGIITLSILSCHRMMINGRFDKIILARILNRNAQAFTRKDKLNLIRDYQYDETAESFRAITAIMGWNRYGNEVNPSDLSRYGFTDEFITALQNK